MTGNTAALAGRLWQRSYREPAGRRGTPSPEKAQLGAEIQGAPGLQVRTWREPWAVARIPTRGKFPGAVFRGARGVQRLLGAAGGVAPGASASSCCCLIRRGPGCTGGGAAATRPPPRHPSGPWLAKEHRGSGSPGAYQAGHGQIR